MKYRNSFVTNSSSSSFICAFCKVNDEDEFKAMVEKFDVDGDIEYGKYKDFANQRWGGYGVDWAMYEEDWGSFFGTRKLNKEDKYAYFSLCCGDDSDFLVDDGDKEDWDCYYDYDIDLDFFPENVQSFINAIEESDSCEYIDSGFGAGRNG